MNNNLLKSYNQEIFNACTHELESAVFRNQETHTMRMRVFVSVFTCVQRDIIQIIRDSISK